MNTAICTKPGHRHGATTTCYDRCRCRCNHCVTNYRAYQRRIARLGPDGKRTAGYVDATRARKHLQTALDTGVSFAEFHRECGVSADTLRRILRGDAPRVWKRTADAILQVRHARVFWVPAWRAQRRVQALEAMGYTQERIARLSGLAPTTIYRAARGESDMERPTFDQLDETFRTHGLRRPEWSGRGELGGITKTRRRARALGYVPAAGWDNIDDESEVPSPARWRASRDLDPARPLDARTVECLRCAAACPEKTSTTMCRDCRDIEQAAA